MKPHAANRRPIQPAWLLLQAAAMAMTVVAAVAQCTPSGQETGKFYCEKDSTYIERVKLCNFRNECSDGQDELACGACHFRHDSRFATPSGGQEADSKTPGPEQCGLKFESEGPAFEWRASDISPDIGRTLDQLKESRLPRGSIKLEPSDLAKRLLARRRAHLPPDATAADDTSGRLRAAVHKARIHFPSLRPTDNVNCELNIWFQTRLNLLRGSAGANVSGGERLLEWPRMSVILLEPNQARGAGEAPRKLKLLSRISLGQASNWFQLGARIGRRLQAFWSLQVLVETRLESNLLSLADFAFDHCEPERVDQLEQMHPRPADEAAAAPLRAPCAPHQFQCKLSGQCVGAEYVCDFGRDCGELDDSDEWQCSAEFEGRCDFEETDDCNWLASPGSSWLWTSSRQRGGSAPPMPLLDHTYQSARFGGHFILANANEFGPLGIAQLIGPSPQLKRRATECHIRFWLNAAPLDGDGPIEWPSAYLAVGFERLEAKELFAGKPKRAGQHEESEWRRFEIALPEQSGDPSSALRFVFRLLAGELAQFKRRLGYLALDDISFSRGCRLAYRDNQESSSICSPNEQFFCAQPAPLNPQVHCIPVGRVCDFKPDCAALASATGSSADELVCPSECRLDGPDTSLGQCGLELADDEAADELAVSVEFNRLFEARLEEGRGLWFESQPKRAAQEASGWQPLEAYSRVDLQTVELRLPAFAQAHANCTLRLEHRWSAGAQNLRASLYLKHQLSVERQLYGHLLSDSEVQLDNGQSKLVAEFGLGERRRKFRLHLEVGAAVEGKPHAGAWLLLGYKFLACAHQPGRLSALDQPTVIEIADDDSEVDGDDDERREGILAPGAGQTEAPADRNCAPGWFQCEQPLLCLPPTLVCDLQLDCQESHLDELECGSRGFQQFDFEPANSQPASNWPTSTTGARPEVRWTTGPAHLSSRSQFNAGPPIDHTLASPWGHFMALWLPNQATAPELIERGAAAHATYSPVMKLAPRCTRMVFYFYHWQGRLRAQKSMKIQAHLIERRAGSIKSRLLYELALDESSEQDRWQRVELELQLNSSPTHFQEDSAGEFRLAFVGRLEGGASVEGAGGAPVFALDDFSLGPVCELSTATRLSELILPINELDRLSGAASAAAKQPAARQSSWSSVVLWLTLAGLAATVLAGLLLARRRMLERRACRAPPAGDQELDDGGSGLPMARLD